MMFSLFKFVRNNRGLSLSEVLVSMGLFGFVVLLFQTVFMMGSTFNKKVENRMHFNQVTADLKSYICTNSSSFKMIGLDAHKTFSFIPGTPDEYQSIESINPSDSRMSDPALTVSLSGLTTEGTLATTQNAIVQNTLTNYSTNPNQYTGFSVGGSPSAETGVRVNQDSHTFTKFDLTTTGSSIMSASDITGKIFISRCIERGTSATIYRKPGYSTTIDMDSPLSTLVYLLNIQHRPFYFPDAAVANRVKCCDTLVTGAISENSAHCSSSDDYNPITYIVNFRNASTAIAGSSALATNVFDAALTHIHEYPALSEMNMIYGSGFVFTLDERQTDPQKFFLDMIVLKNSCNTHFAQSNICGNIGLDTDVNAFQINSGQTLSQVISPTVNSCTGTVSSMDSSIIQL